MGCVGAAHAPSFSWDQVQIPFLQLATTAPENRFISEAKGRNAEWERGAGLLFQEPLPPPGPRRVETSTWSQQTNLQMTEASCDRRKKKKLQQTPSQSQPLRPSGAIKWPHPQTVTNCFLLPMSSGGKSWQKHGRSQSKTIRVDAERPVATRLQTLRLAFPLAIYWWPPANCARGLARADEGNHVGRKAAASMSFHATNRRHPKLKT